MARVGQQGDADRAAPDGTGSRAQKRLRPPREGNREGGGKKAARRRMREEGSLVPQSEAQGGVGPASADGAAHRLRVIEPPSPSARGTLGEAWRYRHAYLYFLRQNIRRRYGRTFLGYLWIFLPVVVPVLLGSLVFGGILGVSPGGGIPYFLYFIIASAAWFAFSTTAFFATRSLEINRSVLGRVRVPRLIPEAAALALPGVGVLIYLVMGAGAVVFYVITRGEFYLVLEPVTLLVPVALVLLILFGLACGLWFSPLAARARDVRRLAGYVLGFWYFLTPVIYPIEEIPSSYRFLASLNPVTAPIETFKFGLLGIGEVTVLGVAVFFGALIVVSVIGLRLFLASERRGIARYY
jgi:lipopolysaccharide transport system permease protein